MNSVVVAVQQVGFLRGGLLRAWAAKSGGDDDPAELDGHVVVGRFGLRGVPPRSRPVTQCLSGFKTRLRALTCSFMLRVRTR
jgi:hypothetical protein